MRSKNNSKDYTKFSRVSKIIKLGLMTPAETQATATKFCRTALKYTALGLGKSKESHWILREKTLLKSS